MRLILGLFVLCLAAAPASAQSPFYAACMTASQGEGALPAGLAQRICGCTETSALAAGETAASLDRYQAFAATLVADGSGMADVEAPPEWAVVTSSILMESMGSCLTDLREEMAAAAETPAPAGTPAPGAGAQPLAPTAPTLPTGLRTGDGTGQVQTIQHGSGAPVRIVG